MELRVHLQQDFHAGTEPFAGGAFEIGSDQHPFGSPAFGVGLRYGRGVTLVFLDKFHVAVTLGFVAFRQFGLYPILIGHLALQHIPYQMVELE